MSEKEYIVTLNKGVDYAQFNQEMISSTGSGDIPDRTVDVADARLKSTRNTHYALTEAEAEKLRNDNRVTDVQLRPEDRDDVEIGYDAVQTANFNKSTADSGDYRDWGKITHSFKENKYGTGTSLGGSFSRPYSMDGTGVDVVIQDSGLQVDHPEFFDANGNSRMQLIDWYTESGLSGTQSGNHYRDYDGHGTHCGGTATGLNFGWASNSKVFSVKVGGLEGSGDSGGISISQCFDVIKGWHEHTKQTQNYAVIEGMIKLVLFDNREKSKTYKSLQEIFIGDLNYNLVTIPTGIIMGYKCIGNKTSILANCSTHPHDPTEMISYDPMGDKVPYNWQIKYNSTQFYKKDSVNVLNIVKHISKITKKFKVNVTTGVGTHQQLVARYFDFDYPSRKWQTSSGHGTMGYDLPSIFGGLTDIVLTNSG